jgi:rubrerythrin
LGSLFAAQRHLFNTTKEISMAALKGSKTEENLKAAFAGESQANRRYLYFANKADVEGQNDVAALFRSTAEGETGHAHGHLEWLEQCGDPATGLPIGPTRDNLKAAVAGETHEYTDMYPGMAKTARDEGFDEVADWFETLAKAERSHANRYARRWPSWSTEQASTPEALRASPSRRRHPRPG